MARWLRAWVFMLVAAGFGTAARFAAAQTGGTPVDWDELERVPQWKPEPMGYAEFFSADYRSKLPPVGRQMMNDCNAWAFAAAKSYHEVLDQGWSADAPARTFSPRWIYNQINKGEDKGSSALSAVTLLRDKGCATLATCPYVAGDYRGQPDATASGEAKFFKIDSFYTLRDGPGIRTALSQGHVVVIGVKTNPVFNSGRYDVYTTDLHAQGQRQRQPGQQHGFHALCIVGYDDSRSAFLVRNSWGTAWGQGGHCWVHYNVAAAFNSRKEEDKGLIDFALVMVDHKSKVRVGSNGVAVGSDTPDKDSVAGRGTGEYRGYDAAQRRQSYFFAASLDGDPASLDLVDRVDWTYVADGAAKRLTSSDRGQYFRVTGAQFVNAFDVAGLVTFKDKTTRPVTIAYRLPAPTADNRQVTLAFEDKYYGTSPVSGRDAPVWSWRVKLAGDAREINDVKHVLWNLGNMLRTEPVINATDEYARGKAGHFAPSGLSIATNQITARVTFNDGSTKDLSIFPSFKSPVDEEIALQHEYTEDDGPDGETNYNFMAWVKFPARYEYSGIDLCEYDYGPTFRNDRKHVATWSTRRFEIFGAAQKEFRLRATLKFKDGTTRTLDRWIELGKDAKYADPLNIEIATYDTYKGLRNGSPQWYVTMLPTGDSDVIAQIAKVVYRMPESWGERRDLTADSDDFSKVLGLHAPIDAVATVTFKDGNFTRLPVKVKPRAPRNDRMALSATSYVGMPVGVNAQPWYWNASVTGPEFETQRIAAMDFFPVIDAGMRQRVRVDPGYHGRPDLAQAQGNSTEAFDLRAVATFTDGSRTVMTAPVKLEPRDGLTSLRGLDVELRERFFGIVDGRPNWALTATLVGDEPKLAEVAEVTFVRGSDKENFRVAAAPFTARIMADRQERVFAHVKLKGGKEQIVGSETTPLGGRTGQPLVLRAARDTAPTVVDGKTTATWYVYLDGWEQRMADVAKVEYLLPPPESGKRVVTERRSDFHDGFATSVKTTAISTVDAVVTLKDGKTVEVSTRAGLPKEPVGWETSDAYFGTDDGKPKWLVAARMTGDVYDLWNLKHVNYFNDGFTTELRRLGPSNGTTYAKPVYQHFLLTAEPFQSNYVLTVVHDQEFNKLPGRMIKPRAAKIDALAIRRAEGFTWDGQADDQKEYVSYVVGPEQELAKVSQVRWVYGDGSAGFLDVWHRWGERFAGFESRSYGKEPPAVKAVVERVDGSKVELTQ